MFSGYIVWVGMSRGQFVGGRNVKAPIDTANQLMAKNID
jgi:hypothetical protein